MPYCYLVRCADDTLYCGWCLELAARLATHNSGKGAKYTRSRLPVQLVWSEYFEERTAAMSREAAVKKLTRLQKMQLIAAANPPQV